MAFEAERTCLISLGDISFMFIAKTCLFSSDRHGAQEGILSKQMLVAVGKGMGYKRIPKRFDQSKIWEKSEIYTYL